MDIFILGIEARVWFHISRNCLQLYARKKDKVEKANKNIVVVAVVGFRYLLFFDWQLFLLTFIRSLPEESRRGAILLDNDGHSHSLHLLHVCPESHLGLLTHLRYNPSSTEAVSGGKAVQEHVQSEGQELLLSPRKGLLALLKNILRPRCCGSNEVQFLTLLSLGLHVQVC